MANATITTSIVIPAYSEAARLATGFARLRPGLDVLDPNATEIIVIDDGSSDDTLRIAHDLYGSFPATLFVQQPTNRGKGAAVRLGIALARGSYVISADADMAIDPRHLPEFVAALHEVELAPGSRADEGRIRYDSPLRTVAGRAFNRVARPLHRGHAA